MHRNENNNNNDDEDDNCSSSSRISVESLDSCMELVEFKSIRNSDNLEEAIVVSWPKKLRRRRRCEDDGSLSSSSSDSVVTTIRYNSIHLTTVLGPDDIAPLFSGSEWAGTRVWHAAVRATEYLDEHHSALLHAGCSLLELGCGLGVPGMIAHQMGANVVLTDQPELLAQLNKNLRRNFADTANGSSSGDTHNNNNNNNNIIARPLSWSREGVRELLGKSGTAANEDGHHGSVVGSRGANNDNGGFDICVNCDCVFEPLYGESWKLLVEVMDELLRVNPKCIMLTCLERRTFDGIDKFLKALDESTHVSNTELIRVDEKNKIELYVTHGR